MYCIVGVTSWIHKTPDLKMKPGHHKELTVLLTNVFEITLTWNEKSEAWKISFIYVTQAAPLEWQLSPLDLFRQGNRAEKPEGVRESTGSTNIPCSKGAASHQSVTPESHPLSSLALGQREGIIQTSSSLAENNAYSKYYSYIHALTYRRASIDSCGNVVIP